MVADRASLLVGSCAWLLALALAGCGGGNSGERGGGGSTGTSGGTTGSGGTTASGGAGGVPTKGYACDDPKAPSTAEMTFTSADKWGEPGFNGGTFTFGDSAADADDLAEVKLTFAAGALTIKGPVPTYSGFGMWFGAIGGQAVPCVDASAYKGVSFNLVDTAGTASTMKFSVQTHDTAPVDVTNKRGNCLYTDLSTRYSECVYPSTEVTVPAGGGVIEVPWSALMSGKPVPGVDPDKALLDGLQWQFPWPSGATEYNADVTIKDVKFY
jgi:hypothetical protein